MYNNVFILGLLVSVAAALPRRATRLEQAASQRHADTQNFKRALYSNHFGVPGTDASYDYIVVGGGTGGLAVAARLAESGQSVAVIEAGGFYEVENGNVSVVPALSLAYDNDTAESFDATPLVDWGFVTTPQPWLGNRSLHYGRGKMLGGSSAENAMIYNRGTEQSYQLWADHVNDSSWTFDALLPYFRKGINFTLPNVDLRAANASVPLPSSEAYNASGGPVQLSFSNFALPFSSWINLGMRELGFPFAQDFSSGHLLGSQYAPSLIDATNEHRSSSQASYLDSAFKAELYNLKVYTHALAKQILFDANKTATAVKVTSGQSTFTLHANEEIVLSAGAFHSPQLLMVSGVGPRETLETNNISIVADRPGVGQFLWDHMDVEITYGVNVESFNNLNSVDYATRAAADFNSFPATGILTSAGADYIGWEKLPEANRANLTAQALNDLTAFPSDWPEIEYEIASVYRSTNTSDSSGYGTIVMINVAPLSRGTVTISSNDTTDLPIVDPKWYSNATDREVGIQGVRRAMTMFNTSAMKPVLTSDAIAPGPDVQTDEQIWDYISQTSFMNWHAACTCRMGRANDPMTAVDSNGRVVGVQGLRVADASAFALLPPGHLTSTVYVVAEKIAADILATN